MRFTKFKKRKMKQITLNIRENNFNTFIEFIKTLDYVEIPEADKKSINELQESLNQVKLIKEGKIKKQSAEDFLNEL
jgi:hypothetical protein